jgi:hypothetical protein
MNTKVNRNNVIIIAAIMAVMITALFLVVKITVTFILAYIFALIGIAAFCMGTIYMISSPKSYPWFTAFPRRIWQYMIAEAVLSAVFVIWENITDAPLSVKWFVFLHIVLMAVFSIPLVMMRSGKDIIDTREEEVKQKTAVLRFMQADMESLVRKFPKYEANLRKVMDALRYSDPMSHPSLAVSEEEIQRGIAGIENLDGDGINKIPELCIALTNKIANRNSRVKIMK